MSEYCSWFNHVPQEIYREILPVVQQRMNESPDETDAQVHRQIALSLTEYCRVHELSMLDRILIGRRIFASLRGYDVLQPLMEDEKITDILVNGPDRIFIEYNGKIQSTDLAFDSTERLEDVIQQIVAPVNRQVNESNPIVDARLPNGYRACAVLPPVALDGPILTIRKFHSAPLTAEDLIHAGTLSVEAADFLQNLVRNRYNLFVCGGTGAGKTTLLNVLSNFISPEERVVTIEDSAELRLSSLSNVVTLETRNKSIGGSGEITIRDLIRTSLRLRPDRIIVGEIRGGEALDMLSAMNTGHDGSLSTGHSNSAQDMISRIETMVLCAAALPLEAIRSQIASAIDIFIYMSRLPDGSRKITEITQVTGLEDHQIRLEPLFSMTEQGLVRTEHPLHRHKGDWHD